MQNCIKNWGRKIVPMILLLTFILWGTAYGEDVVRLSMMPRFFPEKITQMITPLSEYLYGRTGQRVSTVLTRDNADYERSVTEGEIDIGYQNPLVYVNISDVHEVVAMALDETGSKYRGVIIVKSDSEIRTIFDLLGQRVMIVGRTSGGGYFSPRLTLESAGIDMEREMELVEAADNKQENVIISVSIGDVDAGFIRESAFHVADPYIRPHSVRMIHRCAWLPNWAISVKRSLPDTEKSAIKAALINLRPTDSALKALGIKGFREAEDYDYDMFRDILKKDRTLTE